MRSFDASLPDLPRLLKRLLRQIPRGQVSSYGDLAEALGHRSAARWVGQYLLEHPHGPRCPCHRVVRSTGELGGFVQGTAQKARQLAAEGIPVHAGRLELDGRRFAEFDTDRPLAALAARQIAWAALAVRASLPSAIRWVAGVDVSYTDSSHGVAVCTLFDAQSRDRVCHATVRHRVCMPYITGFLAFRELPLFCRAVQMVRKRGWPIDVLLVDGSGLLHPRGAGVAVSLGLACEVPTVGVTKSLLCGVIEAAAGTPETTHDRRVIRYNGEICGAALRPRRTSQRQIYVSPGHRTDVPSAVAVVERLLCGHALPEPLYWADRLSRSVARHGRPERSPSRPVVPRSRR